MTDKATVVIFEGGAPGEPLVRAMTEVRKQIVLDNIEKTQGIPGIGDTVLVTNYRDLAQKARELEATVILADEPHFHFGQRLRDTINDAGMGSVIYMGGAGAPLITPEDLAFIGSKLMEEEATVYMNNPQSADIIAFTPASFINRIDPPDSDNLLGWLLGEAGLEIRMLPASPRMSFDIDTPTDLIILSLQKRGLGPRTRRALKALDWSPSRILQARAMLQVPMSEIALVGRVGPAIVSFINDNFTCRLRVFSEERGMKALGREGRGEVASLLGCLVKEHGPGTFFRYLSFVADAAFIDSRVIMGHGGRKVSDEDRYNSDLGRPNEIRDESVKAFTESALDCPIPVALGGHSLVSGGLWLLAESLLNPDDASS